eukprot:57519_1
MSYRPVLTREQTYAKINENKYNANLCWSVILIPPAVAALIIASTYAYHLNESECVYNIDGGKYLIALDLFLYVGAAYQIGNCILQCLFAKLRTGSDKMGKCFSLCGCFAFIFLTVWSIIGLLEYGNMTVACQSHPIGVMVLSWCIINLIHSFCICCGLCLMLYIMICVDVINEIIDE